MDLMKPEQSKFYICVQSRGARTKEVLSHVAGWILGSSRPHVQQ